MRNSCTHFHLNPQLATEPNKSLPSDNPFSQPLNSSPIQRCWDSLSFVDIVVQLLSCVWRFSTPWTVAYQASLSFAISQSLLKLMSIELAMPSNYLILCHPQSFPASESALCIKWPKYWSFSFSTSPFNEFSALISFRIDWFDLRAVQGNSQESFPAS